MKIFLFCLLNALLFSTICGQKTEVAPDKIYEDFAAAYESFDLEKVTSLYLPDGELLNIYDKSVPQTVKGTDELRKYYSEFFQSYQKEQTRIGITFKVANRRQIGTSVYDSGFYRFEIIPKDKAPQMYFGKFITVLEQTEKGWKFRTDATTNGDFTEFENVNSKTIPKRIETLYAPFYDEFLGNYETENKEIITIGRSQTRLYAYFENSHKLRGLNKVNAHVWTSGETIISDAASQKFVFKTPNLEIYKDDKLIIKAVKTPGYQTEKIEFLNKAGIKLGGTVFKPNKPNGKGIVLVHGSGEQDRNGYASIIRFLADSLAREGLTVLTYDKQGIGESLGNWESLNFTKLAQDALAGIDYLKKREELKLTKIGLGGSSQAGWVISKAAEISPQVDFAILIGAAGSGVNVMEQNLYNTEVLMKCSNRFSSPQIETALTQQKYFFDFLLTRKNADKLDALTRTASEDKALAEWLFPASSQIDFQNRNQWFTALEINFEPIDVWKNYKNPILMLFSEFDDSTPTDAIKKKIAQLKKKNIQTVVIKNSQHLGLTTDSVCNGDVGNLDRFDPNVFKAIRQWVKDM